MKNIFFLIIASALFLSSLDRTSAELESVEIYCWCHEMIDSLSSLSDEKKSRIMANTCLTSVALGSKEILLKRNFKKKITNRDKLIFFEKQILEKKKTSTKIEHYDARLVFLLRYSDGTQRTIVYLDKHNLCIDEETLLSYNHSINDKLREFAEFDFSCSNGVELPKRESGVPPQESKD